MVSIAATTSLPLDVAASVDPDFRRNIFLQDDFYFNVGRLNGETAQSFGRFGYDSVSNQVRVEATKDGAATAPSLTFRVGDPLVEAMRINSTGFIGVNLTTAPSAFFEIRGTDAVAPLVARRQISTAIPTTSSIAGIAIGSTSGEPDTDDLYAVEFFAANSVGTLRSHGFIGAASDAAGASTGRISIHTYLGGIVSEKLRVNSFNAVNLTGSLSVGLGAGVVPAAGIEVFTGLFAAGMFTRQDSSTATALETLSIRRGTTGIPANGIGVSQAFYVHDSTGVFVEAARIQVDAEDVMAASFSARVRHFLRIDAITAERWFERETTEAAASGVFDIVPTTDNTGNIGVPTLRWTLVRAVTITSGRHVFQDEATKRDVWAIHENKEFLYFQELSTGKDIMKVDREGNLYIKGKVKPLN